MEASAIPLAFLAGILSLLSPCVLPMLPAVVSSAIRSSPAGLWMMALGLSVSFALAGSVLTYWLLSLDLRPEALRTISAIILLVMGVFLLFKTLGDAFTRLLSRMQSYLPIPNIQSENLYMQLLVGVTLGMVWLPCVGPTLGTAIALASMGENMSMAFLVMWSFGLGTALPLIVIGFISHKSLERVKLSGEFIRRLMGGSLLLVALMILTGLDRILEIWAMDMIPAWIIEI